MKNQSISGIQGYAKGTFKSSYVRLLVEGIGKIPLNDKVSLNLGVGVGAAQAKTTQEGSLFLTDGFDSISDEGDSDEDTIGFSWEISPSIDFHLEKAALSFGLRYSQFPKIKETDETNEIDWKAWGFFAGVKF